MTPADITTRLKGLGIPSSVADRIDRATSSEEYWSRVLDPSSLGPILACCRFLRTLSLEDAKSFCNDRPENKELVSGLLYVVDMALASMRLEKPDSWKIAHAMIPGPVPEESLEFQKMLEVYPPPRLEEEFLLSGVRNMYILTRWFNFGLPIFELTHSLFASFLLTDPSNVPTDDLIQPFPTFYIRFPVPFWTMDVKGIEQDVSGMWVHKFKEDGRTATDLWLTLATSSLGRFITEPAAGSRVGEWVRSQKMDDRMEDLASKKVVEVPNRVRHQLRASIRLYANLCLYLSELKSEGKQPGRSTTGKNRKARTEEARPSTVILGREIKLNRNLMDAAKNWAGIHKSGRGGWGIYVRFMVRGHWRQQVCGERRRLPDGKYTPWVDHKQVLIAPFWKGPEGPMLQHLYRLGEEPGVAQCPTNLPDPTIPIQ